MNEIEEPRSAKEETDEQLFADVMGEEPLFEAAAFARAAIEQNKDRCASATEEAEDIVWANETRAHFESLTKTLLDVTLHLHSHLLEYNKSDRFHLNANNHRLAEDALDFISCAEAVDAHVERARLFDLASYLIETGFYIGQLVERSPTKTRDVLKGKMATWGSKGGKTSSAPRTAESEGWRAWLTAEVERIKTSNPGLSSEDLASKLEHAPWPKSFGEPRARRTILDHIRSLNRRAAGSVKNQ